VGVTRIRGTACGTSSGYTGVRGPERAAAAGAAPVAEVDASADRWVAAVGCMIRARPRMSGGGEGGEMARWATRMTGGVAARRAVRSESLLPPDRVREIRVPVGVV
jgi:hypothetical protein